LPLVKLILPRILSLPNGERELVVEASKLEDVIEYLVSIIPELRARLLDQDGRLKSVFSIYVNGKNAALLKGLETELKAGDEVSLIPSVVGG